MDAVGYPKNTRHALLTTPPLAHLFTCAAPRFRKCAHLFKEQFAELVRPSLDTLKLVGLDTTKYGPSPSLRHSAAPG